MNPEISFQKRWIARQFLFEGLLQELDAHFCRMGIAYMPIKGAYLICAGLAEKIRVRRMIDIDILVHPDSFDAVNRYFCRCEKARLHEDKWRFEQPFYYRYRGMSVHVEIHRMVNRPERFFLPAEYLFERSISSGKYLRLPRREDALLIACCHTLAHLGYYLHEDVFKDMLAIGECTDFDWDEFWEGAKKTGIRPFIEFLFLLHPNERLKVSASRSYGVFPGMWAAMFEKTYHKLPCWGRRMLFELPFVRQPLRLMWQSMRDR
ncbi:MAG: nucleotidyltransferase family protein [Chitinispirillaceae bacterium]